MVCCIATQASVVALLEDDDRMCSLAYDLWEVMASGGRESKFRPFLEFEAGGFRVGLDWNVSEVGDSSPAPGDVRGRAAEGLGRIAGFVELEDSGFDFLRDDCGSGGS